MGNGEVMNIDTSISVEIENGEDIIGYQYLHGTNADVGGFQIKGVIAKTENGATIFNMQYTWNDIIDPNPEYASDTKKARIAKLIPYANPKGYVVSITWHDISIKPAKSKFPKNSIGWMVS